jgi:hypothetical protein
VTTEEKESLKEIEDTWVKYVQNGGRGIKERKNGVDYQQHSNSWSTEKGKISFLKGTGE